MANEYKYTDDEMNKLQGDLKVYEAKLSGYLDSPDGKKDPNYTKLADSYIELETAIYNVSIKQLQLAADAAGKVVSAINSAVDNLNAAIAARESVAKDLAVAQAAVSFVTAIVSQNPSAIVSSGGALVSSLKAA
jgi:hypothetical protein